MIQEMWNKATALAQMEGVDVQKKYAELLEAKIVTITLIRDAALKKTSDLLMTCRASTFFAPKDDPAHALYEKLHKLVVTILSTSEKKIADDMSKKQFEMRALRTKLIKLLIDSGVGSATMADSEIIAAFAKLLGKGEASDGTDAKESEKAT